MKWTDVTLNDKQVADVAVIISAVDIDFKNYGPVDLEYGNMVPQETPGPYPMPVPPPDMGGR